MILKKSSLYTRYYFLLNVLAISIFTINTFYALNCEAVVEGSSLRDDYPVDDFYKLPSALPSQQKKIEIVLNRAEESLNIGKWRDALQYAQIIILNDPGNTKAYAIMGTVYAITGAYQEAEEVVSILKEGDPGSPYLPLIQGLLEFQKGRLDQMQKRLSEVLTHEPENPVARYYLAIVHAIKGDTVLAEKGFKEVLESHPRFAPALASLGGFHMEADRLKEAIRYYRKAVEIDPDNLLYRRELSSLYRRTGQQEAEKELLQDLLHRVAGVKQAYLENAMQLLLQGAFKEAIDLADRGFSSYEDFADGYYIKAAALINMEKKQEALVNLKKYIAARPKFDQAYYYAGMCYLAVEDFKGAAEHLNKAKEINPSLSRCAINLAVIKQLEGDVIAAKGELDSLDSRLANSALAHYIKANFLMEMGARFNYVDEIKQVSALIPGIGDRRITLDLPLRDDKARIDTARGRNLMVILFVNGWYNMTVKKGESILRNNEKDIITLYLKGLAHGAQRKYTQAAKTFQEIVNLQPYLIGAYMELGSLNMQMNQPGKAMASFQEAVRIDPSYAPARMVLGMFYVSQKDTEKAVFEFQEAVRLDPSSPRAHQQLALIYAEDDKDLENAMTFASKAVELDPANPLNLDILGWVCVKLGDQTQAIGKLTEAAQIDPENPIIRYHLGIAYFRKDDLDNAKQELEKALSISKQFPDASHASKVLEEIKLTIGNAQ